MICCILHRSKRPSFLWNTCLITQSGRQLPFQLSPSLCWGNRSPWASPLYFFSVLLQVLSVVSCCNVLVAHLAVAVMTRFVFSLSLLYEEKGRHSLHRWWSRQQSPSCWEPYRDFTVILYQEDCSSCFAMDFQKSYAVCGTLRSVRRGRDKRTF